MSSAADGYADDTDYVPPSDQAEVDDAALKRSVEARNVYDAAMGTVLSDAPSGWNLKDGDQLALGYGGTSNPRDPRFKPVDDGGTIGRLGQFLDLVGETFMPQTMKLGAQGEEGTWFDASKGFFGQAWNSGVDIILSGPSQPLFPLTANPLIGGYLSDWLKVDIDNKMLAGAATFEIGSYAAGLFGIEAALMRQGSRASLFAGRNGFFGFRSTAVEADLYATKSAQVSVDTVSSRVELDDVANIATAENRILYNSNGSQIRGSDGKFVNTLPDAPDPTNLKRAELRQMSDGRWKLFGAHDPRTAKGTYNYVVQDGKIYVGIGDSLQGHVDIARGKPVEYAGQIKFGSGKDTKGMLIEWNNGSGHYVPEPALPDWARDFKLPFEKFKVFDHD